MWTIDEARAAAARLAVIAAQLDDQALEAACRDYVAALRAGTGTVRVAFLDALAGTPDAHVAARAIIALDRAGLWVER